MKFHFLGTCSGTEPMPDMHHQSWILEVNGINYWFDAGENCAHRAYTSGVQVMNTAAIFISHPHIDHIGGLANLLSCFQKLERMYKLQFVRNNTLKMFFPDLPLLESIKNITFMGKEHNFRYNFEEYGISDGLLFEDENVRITALHNAHLKEDGSNGWHAFSFLIEAEGKRIIFSGDIRSVDELLPFLVEPCDMLIMETGHHDVDSVMEFAVAQGIKNLRFTHHGRQILENREHYEKQAEILSAANPICIRLCYDGMTEHF